MWLHNDCLQHALHSCMHKTASCFAQTEDVIIKTKAHSTGHIKVLEKLSKNPLPSDKMDFLACHLVEDRYKVKILQLYSVHVELASRIVLYLGIHPVP